MFKPLLTYTSGLIASFFKPQGVDAILKQYQKTVDDLNAVAASKLEEADALDAKADKLYQKADAAEAESLRASRLAGQFSQVLLGDYIEEEPDDLDDLVEILANSSPIHLQ